MPGKSAAHGLCPALKAGDLHHQFRTCKPLQTWKGCSSLEWQASTREFLLLWDKGGHSGWLLCLSETRPFGQRLASLCMYCREADLTGSRAACQIFEGLCLRPSSPIRDPQSCSEQVLPRCAGSLTGGRRAGGLDDSAGQGGLPLIP